MKWVKTFLMTVLFVQGRIGCKPALVKTFLVGLLVANGMACSSAHLPLAPNATFLILQNMSADGTWLAEVNAVETVFGEQIVLAEKTYELGHIEVAPGRYRLTIRCYQPSGAKKFTRKNKKDKLLSGQVIQSYQLKPGDQLTPYFFLDSPHVDADCPVLFAREP